MSEYLLRSLKLYTAHRPTVGTLRILRMVLIVTVALLVVHSELKAQLKVYENDEERPKLMNSRGFWVEGSLGVAWCRSSYDVSSFEYQVAAHFHPLAFPIVGLRLLDCTTLGAPFQADLSFEFNVTKARSLLVLFGVGGGYYRRSFYESYPLYNSVIIETWTVPIGARILVPINNTMLFSTQLSTFLNPQEALTILNVGFWFGTNIRE